MPGQSARYLGAAVILGIMALVNSVWFRHNPASTGIAVTLYVLIMVVAFFSGRAAHRAHWRPGWFGAAVGALFGVLAGLGSFLIRATSEDVDAPARGIARLRLVALANSPVAHVVVLITAVLTFSIISLIVASLAAATAKDPDPHRESA
ncbi:hypothetical protein [Sulfobacillus harzensis]|uniref:Uncharacterized protein n=1 Tax=Sulfobacillus harzensis TaxID=2729629 RepID=A0A7Y0L3Q6_9FIRM|nr:hypothetical protein [Sulfobacillus harzensis]NMP22528.1 hypothetical protein [Sulfobacillus harzensis]